MNPDVKALKRRTAQPKCFQCSNYDPREGRCGQRDLFLDGQSNGCESFAPARVVKWERRTRQDSEREVNEV